MGFISYCCYSKNMAKWNEIGAKFKKNSDAGFTRQTETIRFRFGSVQIDITIWFGRDFIFLVNQSNRVGSIFYQPNRQRHWSTMENFVVNNDKIFVIIISVHCNQKSRCKKVMVDILWQPHYHKSVSKHKIEFSIVKLISDTEYGGRYLASLIGFNDGLCLFNDG